MRATTFKRERAEARAASPKSELDEGRPLLRLEDAAPHGSLAHCLDESCQGWGQGQGRSPPHRHYPCKWRPYPRPMRAKRRGAGRKDTLGLPCPAPARSGRWVSAAMEAPS